MKILLATVNSDPTQVALKLFVVSKCSEDFCCLLEVQSHKLTVSSSSGRGEACKDQEFSSFVKQFTVEYSILDFQGRRRDADGIRSLCRHLPD